MSVWLHLGLLSVVTSFFSIPSGSEGLKLVKVIIPPVSVKGDVTRLECLYDLELDRLYSVLWYKDHEEFYRYIPRNNPKQHSYKLEGFRVDPHLSNDHQVYLRNINLKASGVYRCEVSAEAPSFTSVHAEGTMDVVALPKDDPHISGQQQVYNIGDTMSLNCTSGRSFPPAELTWFVNDRQASPEFAMLTDHHGLMKTVIGLSQQIGPEHLQSGHMVIKCLSTISTGKKSQRELKPVLYNREALLLVQAFNASSRLLVNLLCLLLVFLPT